MRDIDACLLARFPGTRPPDWLRRRANLAAAADVLLARPGPDGTRRQDGPPGRASPGEPAW
jgi:hypothetical protein